MSEIKQIENEHVGFCGPSLQCLKCFAGLLVIELKLSVVIDAIGVSTKNIWRRSVRFLKKNLSPRPITSKNSSNFENRKCTVRHYKFSL